MYLTPQIAALIVNLVLWPYHARVQFIVKIAKAIRDISKLYLSMSRQLLEPGQTLSEVTRREFERLEQSIQATLSQCDGMVDTMNAEFSLMPKPVSLFRHLVTHLRAILDLLLGLRRIRERIPRDETVKAVLSDRAEMVSAVLLNLFAVGHSLRTRSALPQYLPSPRIAVESLIDSIRLHVRDPLSSSGVSSRATSIKRHSQKHSREPLSTVIPPAAVDRSSSTQDPLALLRATLHAHLGRSASPRGSPAPHPEGSVTPPNVADLLDNDRDLSLELAFVYALAENHAMSLLVTEVIALVDLTRMLCGTASFIHSEVVDMDLGMSGVGRGRRARGGWETPGKVGRVDRD